MANLLIIESPSKIGTIKSCLGSGYKVVASIGHVRDLPKSTLGVDIDNDFEPKYINIRGKGDLIKELKKEAKAASKVFLATDPDREGEAISWHLVQALDLPDEKVKRVTFNELTKTAIKTAIKNPRDIDMDTVNAQQARRILDRIVGYKLSPYLWKRVKSGLSAGRVQSVATRIIVEREDEIRAFTPSEYWTIEAKLQGGDKEVLVARFFGDKKNKIELANEAEAMKVVSAVEGGEFVVKNVKKALRQKNPLPPFTTSTMQQEASKKLGFHSQRIMKVAQELYEGISLGSEHGGVHGLITYMRTDSLRVSDEAANSAREYIVSKYGDRYYPETRRVYKTKANAQDAHEAIRPTDVTLEPDMIKARLTNDQYKLYKLIWSRFVASQMASAEIDTVNADIESAGYIFHSSGYSVKFAGYMSIYEESEDENTQSGYSEKDKKTKLPSLTNGESLKASAVLPEQHFTEPPPRYTEASLIKFLEEKGIGRPSTFTPIITTIIARGYVKREGKSLVATQLGEITTRLMVAKFPTIVDYGFTANIEDKLDEIENGDETLLSVLKNFYGDFSESLEAAMADSEGDGFELAVEETDIICEKCQSKMIVKEGRYGKFAACPNYPKCKNTKPLTAPKMEEKEKPEAVSGEKCENCGADMVVRTGKFGSFLACSNYPKCKTTKQITKDIGVACPKCGAKVIQKHGRNKSVFYSCERYPDCDFSSWDMPAGEKCPDCCEPLFVKKGKNIAYCKKEGCTFKKEIEIKE
ncbi:MAG: type I DNA topoisomerase [Ruminococcaceae bacterium]|nr:type I DNA topoisomerase [Oscillospiraceae bacterium]